MAFSVEAYKLIEYAQTIAETDEADGIYTSDLLKGLIYLLRGNKLPENTLQTASPLRYSKAAIYTLKRAGKEAMTDRSPLRPYHVLFGLVSTKGKAEKILSSISLSAEQMRNYILHMRGRIYISEDIFRRIRDLNMEYIDCEAQFIEEPLSPYEEVMWVDPGVYPLVCALNRVRGVRTTSSCEGHRNDEPASVDFECPISFILSLRQIEQYCRGFVVVRVNAVEHLELCRCSILIHYQGVKEILYSIQRKLIRQLENLGLLTEQGKIAFIPLRNWLREYQSSKVQHSSEGSMRYDIEPKCLFCGRGKDKVQKLLACPEGVFICDRCVLMLVKVLGEEHLPIFEEMLEIIKRVEADRSI